MLGCTGSIGASTLRVVARHPERFTIVAVTALGILGIKDAGESLVRALRDDADPIVRGQAAQALGQIGYRQAASSWDW